MYSWLWRRLPLPTPWKIAMAVLAALVVAAVLWYVVFPYVDAHLPGNDVDVT
jgi:hypothetical protein